MLKSLITILMTFSLSAHALLSFENATQPEFVTSARALAMGNAYIAKVDDPWAAFYNPAGLGTVRKSTLHLFNVHAETNKGFNDIVGGTKATDIPKNAMKMTDEAQLYSLMNANRGHLTHARLNLFPNFTTRFFQMGYLFSEQDRARLATTATSSFELAHRRDMGPVVALNLSLFGGVIKLGASSVYLSRSEMIKDIATGSTISVTSADYAKGTALITTLGGKLTLPIYALPTFAAVLRNATAADFKQTGTQTLSNIKQTVDVGFSLTPMFGRQFRMHLEANMKDVNQKYNIKSSRRLCGGVEFDYARKIFVRFGYSDGFGSAGLGARTTHLMFDLTTYAVDVSDPGSSTAIEDRRFAFSISSGL